jgi:hypothetical protein
MFRKHLLQHAVVWLLRRIVRPKDVPLSARALSQVDAAFEQVRLVVSVQEHMPQSKLRKDHRKQKMTAFISYTVVLLRVSLIRVGYKHAAIVRVLKIEEKLVAQLWVLWATRSVVQGLVGNA